MARIDLTHPRTPSSALDERDLLAVLGPMIDVEIGFDPDYDPDDPATMPPKLAATGVRALLDTGAAACYIDTSLAIRLNLAAIDKQLVTPVLGGVREIVTYLGQIHIPSLAFTIYGSFGGLDLVASGLQFAAVLGREFLMHCKLMYDGPSGGVWLEL